jgi:hypothetical protein
MIALRRALPAFLPFLRGPRGVRGVPGVQGPLTREKPEAALFNRLRLNLTLLYAAVLAAMLVAMGVALYIALRGQLLQPAATRVVARARFHAEPWALGQPGVCATAAAGRAPGGGTPPPRAPTETPFWIACFDPTGKVFLSSTDPPPPPNSAVPPPVLPELASEAGLVERAIRDGAAWDMVDGGSAGTLIRGAAAVRNPAGQILGVTQITQPVAEQLNTLSLVRNLLFGLGSLVVALASAGGWLLASRALAPARLAFARQQAFVSDASRRRLAAGARTRSCCFAAGTGWIRTMRRSWTTSSQRPST